MEPIAETVQESMMDVGSFPLPAPPETPSERRREPRFATDRLTLLTVTGRTSVEPILCRILDYSGSGLRIRTQKRLDPGTEVRVTLREMFALANVRYCISAGDGFDHGIQVQEVRAANP